MSQIKVNALVSYSGNTVTLGTSGDTINVASNVPFKVDTIQNTNSSTLITQTNSTTITVGVSGQTVALPSQSISYAAISNAVDFRNIVINGDMQVAQRSTSVASITTTGYYTVDRWLFDLNSFGTWTMSQSTDVPTGYGFANSLKLDCTTADAAPSAGDFLLIRTRFEGQNLQYLKKGTANALPLTASFWVKSTKTGTFICELEDVDNTRSISKSYTVNTTNTWEFKTVTFAGDTTGTLNNDNGNSLDLIHWLGAGSTYSSGTLATTWGSTTSANRAVGQVNCADSTSNDFLITGVQLEAGEQASGFEFMPIDVNLARCQRYFQKLNSGTETIGQGYMLNPTTFVTHITYPVYMRTAPSLIGTSGTNFYCFERNIDQDFFNSFTISAATVRTTALFNNTEVSGTTGISGITYGNNASASLALSAEL